MSTDPASVGTVVLANLAEGRQKAIAEAQARGAVTVRAVRQALDIDVLESRRARGRAGRIARRLQRDGQRVGERQVRKILERLFSGSDSAVQSRSTATEDHPP